MLEVIKTVNKKNYIKAILILLLILIINPFSYGYGIDVSSRRNETVYVILDPSGKVLEERVVNWIKRGDNDFNLVDYGDYSSIKSLTSPLEPQIINDKIIWTIENHEVDNLFTEGITKKELPFEISILYYLNERKIDPKNLIGKQGKVQIELNIINKKEIKDIIKYKNVKNELKSEEELFCLPLIFQITYQVNLNKFDNIVAKDADKIVIGQNMQLNFLVFPYPDSKISWEMYGSDIEINPISITVLPKFPTLPEINIERELLNLFNAILSIENGLLKVSNGFRSLIEGSGLLGDGILAIRDALSEVENGINELDINYAKLLTGLKQIDENFNQLIDGQKKLSNGLLELKNSVSEYKNSIPIISLNTQSLLNDLRKLNNSISEITMDISELRIYHNDLTQKAEKLIAENEEGSDLHELGTKILEEEKMIETILENCISTDVEANNFKNRVEQFNKLFSEQYLHGILNLSKAIEDLYSGSMEIKDGMNKYYKSLQELSNGIIEYLEGVKYLIESLREIYSNYIKIPQNYRDILNAQISLSEGLNKLENEGIINIRKALEESINQLRLENAKKDNLLKLSNECNSFMDNNKNKRSNVQFILQTQALKKEKAKIIERKEQIIEKKLTIYDRIRKFFKDLINKK